MKEKIEWKSLIQHSNQQPWQTSKPVIAHLQLLPTTGIISWVIVMNLFCHELCTNRLLQLYLLQRKYALLWLRTLPYTIWFGNLFLHESIPLFMASDSLLTWLIIFPRPRATWVFLISSILSEATCKWIMKGNINKFVI